ncbi:phage tail tape measure protein [Streptomyces sp. CCM_MD2014]|uniref:phage tail tape measure protein n=1 Tax=Streptomyces sp. CCM_MD2014 TaxID=1561022 RepID=UPI0007760EE8|nr:phage tail tape measure protein [Streptomyces sp. CCM_MD2014]
MAGDEIDYGSARITIDLDDTDAERQASSIGADIERALTRATRNIGRTVSRNLQRSLRRLSIGARVEPDLSRFERTLRRSIRGMAPVAVPVTADLRQFQRGIRRGGGDAVSVPVSPDLRRFARDLRRGLRGIQAEVQVRADARALIRDIERELRRVSPPAIRIPAEVDLSRLRSELASLDVPRIHVQVSLDVARVEAELRDLASRTITIPVTLGEPGGGDPGGGLLDALRGSLSGAGGIGLGAGAAALGGIRAGLLAAGPWGAIAAGVAAYAAAIGKVLMTGIEGVIEHQQIAGALRAALGLGEAAANQVGRVVGQLYARGVVESVEEGTAAVQAALRNGLAAPDDLPGLESISTKVSDLGRLMEEDIGKVARAIGTMVKTGLVDNATEGLDLLTRSVQQGGNVAEDLLDTFTEYPTQFRQLGLSAEEAFGLIQQGLRGGARDSDVIADALKEFSIEAAQGGKRVVDAFKAMHLDAERLTDQFAKGGPEARSALAEIFDELQKIEDPLERNQAAVGLFGTKAEDLAGALASLDLTNAAKELDGFGGAAGRAGDALRDDLGTKLQTIGREIKQAFQGLFTGDFSQFADVGRAIEDALPDLKATGAHIAESIQQGITEYGPKVFAALFDLAFEIGERVDIWGPLLLKIIAGASALPAVIGSLILTAIAGGLAGIGSKLLPYLETAWDAVASFITETVPQVGADLASGLADVFTGAFASARDAVSSGIDTVVGFFTGLPGRIASAASSLGGQIGGFFTSAFETGKQAVSDGTTAVVDFFVQLPGRILAGLAALPGLLLDAFTSAVAYVAIGLLTAVAGIVFVFTELPGRIWNALLGLGALLLAAFQAGWSAVTAWLGQALTSTIAFFAALPGRVGGALASFGSFLLGALVSGFNSARSRISGWISEAVGFFAALPGRVGGALSSFGSFLLRNIVAGFNSARSRISGWISEAVGFFRALPGKIGSALSALPGRLASAFSSAASRARSAVSSLISGIVGLFRGLPGKIVSAVGNIGGQIMSKIKSGLPSAVKKYLPFANGGVVLGPTHALIGEAGPEVVIPLTRPKRARQLAQESGLLDILGGARPPRPGGGETAGRTVNQYVTINEVGDARTTAHRVTSRLAVAGGLL